jgi:branched-subunit amino acid ABC-type transport system permease component
MTASRVTPDRVVAALALALALAAPLYVSTYWLGQLLTQMLFLGIAAASLIFLSAYGGMGSLGGAAIGSLLLGLTTNFAAAYLPSNYTYYSIIFTFVLVAIVLAVRPLGLFGRPA